MTHLTARVCLLRVFRCRGQQQQQRQVIQRRHFVSSTPEAYEKWKDGKGPVPRDVLLDDSGKEVFSPDINPDFRITNDALPPEVQDAVNQHLLWACLQDYTIPGKRNMARHYKLDSRPSLKKTKRKSLRKEFVPTPFVLIGAYQSLLRKAFQYPYDPDEDVAGDNIRNANLPFGWFQKMSNSMMHLGQAPNFPKQGKANADVKVLILKEALAMLMRPVVAPFLPSHSWFLQSMKPNATPDDWVYVSGKTRVESMAREQLEYDTSLYSVLTWNLGANGDIVLNPQQIKAINNVVTPYVSHWWPEHIHRLMNLHGTGTKKQRKWAVTQDEYSSLPSLLIDILFMRVDYSDTLKQNPVYKMLQTSQQSDWKKQKVGVGQVRNLPKKLDDVDYIDVNYHRWGPAICFTYMGPEKFKEKLCQAVAVELKSSQAFDRKLVDGIAFSETMPRKPKTKKQKMELKKAEAKLAEQLWRVDIARAGTKKTKNSKRLALQSKGRTLEQEGRLHLDKTGSVPIAQEES